MCGSFHYAKTNPGRAIASLLHTQKSDEKNCEIHDFFLRIDFAEALSHFANIVATLTSGFRISPPVLIPSLELATPSTL